MVSADEARRELARRELAKRRSAQPSTASDVVQSAGAGVRRGIEGLVGMFGDVGAVQGKIAGWAAGKLGAGPDMQETVGNVASYLTPFPTAPTSETLRSVTDPVLGEAYMPQTTAGEYARTIGEFAPAALGGPGNFGRRAVTQALLPALGSETAGQITKGSDAEPYARVAGALIGGIAPSAAARLVSPFPISPERQALVQTLRDEGVDLTAGQTTGRDSLRYAESELGGGAGARFAENQAEQFTAAALQRAGIDARRATPEVMDQAFGRIGQQFDDLAARNIIQPDPQLGQDLGNAFRGYNQVVPESQRSPIIQDLVGDITAAAAQGPIPGEFYQRTTSRLAAMARGTTDSDRREALQGIRAALDDAMERSIAATNPADLGGWQEARRQYRNILVLEKAATGAGENAAQGLISPSQLRNATVTAHGRRNYARGQGDFAELARAGEGVMKALPQSGTAPRTAARNIGTSLPAIMGAGAGSAGGLPGMLLGGAVGAAAPFAVGRAMLSGPGRAYLGNQVASGLNSNPRIAAIVAALMARQSALPAPGQ